MPYFPHLFPVTTVQKLLKLTKISQGYSQI